MNKYLLLLVLVVSNWTPVLAQSADNLNAFWDIDGPSVKNPELIVFNGEGMIFDYDITNDDVRWWRSNTGSWESLDGSSTVWGRVNGYVGSDGIEAVVWGNVLHLFYTQGTSAGTTGTKLRHAMFNGYAWVFETLDGNGGTNGQTSHAVGGKPSATVWSNRLVVAYVDYTDRDVRIGSFDHTDWTFSTLDGAGGSGGQTSGLCGAPFVMNTGTDIWIFYVCQSVNHCDLRHASWDGTGAWNFAVRDGQSGMGTTESMCNATISGTMFSSYAHVFYSSTDSVAHETLRHAWTDSNGWNYQAMDGDSSSGGRTANDVISPVVAIQNSKMHVYYFDVSVNFNLRHAWGAGSSWTYETADGYVADSYGRVDSYVGRNPATFDFDYPLVVYEDFYSNTVRMADAASYSP